MTRKEISETLEKILDEVLRDPPPPEEEVDMRAVQFLFFFLSGAFTGRFEGEMHRHCYDFAKEKLKEFSSPGDEEHHIVH